MKGKHILIAAGVVVLAATGCVNRDAQKQAKDSEQFLKDPVRAVTAQLAGIQTLTESAEITGEITAGLDTEVNARNPGRITQVFVRDGDAVHAGQIIASQETTTLVAQRQSALAQIAQANGGLAQAQSVYAQARRNLALGPTKSSAAVKVAQAQVQAAEAAYIKAQRGARQEDRNQADANVASAKQNLDTQKTELERIRALVAEGAIASNRLDQQLNTYAGALAQYNNALEAQRVTRNATRPEDLESARQAVEVAKENLRSAKAQQDLDPLLQDQVNSAKAQIETAQAQVASAKAQLEVANQNLADAQIRAPFSGRISGKPIQVGSVPGNGVAIARIVSNDGLYFEGEIPSSVIDRVRVGSSVDVSVTAAPGKKYIGTIAGLNPLASTIGRNVKARIVLTGDTRGLQSGLFARGIVSLNSVPNATVVPVTALLGEGDNRSLFIIDNGLAKRVNVTVGIQQGQMVQVTGLPAGANVIVKGQDVIAEGNKVRADSPKQASAKPTEIGG